MNRTASKFSLGRHVSNAVKSLINARKWAWTKDFTECCLHINYFDPPHETFDVLKRLWILNLIKNSNKKKLQGWKSMPQSNCMDYMDWTKWFLRQYAASDISGKWTRKVYIVKYYFSFYLLYRLTSSLRIAADNRSEKTFP